MSSYGLTRRYPKYLGLGVMKGVGPHFAEVLVKAFAEDVFTIIETNPQAMHQSPGIGSQRIEK